MNRNPRDFPIPARMAKLPRDKRGYPIFAIAYRDADGSHFTVNDEARRQHVIREDRCSICGDKLMRGRWYVGGPLSAFHARGCYLDPPVHAECGHYALMVCPYLAAPNYNGYIEGRTIKPERAIPLVRDGAMTDERPPVFAFVMASGQSHKHNRIAGIEVVQYLKPHRPFSRVEFWQHGQRINYPTAMTVMRDHELQALGEYIAKHGPIQRKVAA